MLSRRPGLLLPGLLLLLLLLLLLIPHPAGSQDVAPLPTIDIDELDIPEEVLEQLINETRYLNFTAAQLASIGTACNISKGSHRISQYNGGKPIDLEPPGPNDKDVCPAGLACFLSGKDTLNGLQGNWYMTADFSLRCYDATYNGMLALAILLVVFFAVGIPVLFAFLLHRRRDDLEDPKTKKLLGMLYSSYKPEAYWFESVQMGFKLALWVSLALFKDDPQLKIAIALLVCFVQVILHAYLRPFNSFEKNASQALGIITAFTVSFGGLVINYLNESMRNAYLLSNKELHASLKVKLGTFKAVLEVVVYLTLFGYGIVGVIWVVKKLKKNEDRMRKKCGKYCKCLGIRFTERDDEDEDEEGEEERSRAAVNPSGTEDGGGGESKQRGAVEMTDLVRRENRARPQSIDLDADEMGGTRSSPSDGGGRVWSFSQTSLAKEARDFQTVNPLHSPQ
eukprot:g2368.t1